ncbi:MAG: hypothetical protein RR324_01375, partial [Cellulosilyticaceae bacterium]
ASAEWTPKYAYGEALDAAIEFNGNWVRPTGQQRFTIETEAEPYVAIVAKDGTLTIQKGMATPLTLDTGVTQVSMIRGYKSQEYLTQDQGLIVAYIKVNKAYYRSYAYSEALGAMYWYPAELLHADNFDFVHVHRLNDYRVGFALSSSIVNYWLTTTRTYVAQACPPESINYEVDQIWSFTAINVPANTNRTVTILEQEEPSNIFILTFPFTILSMFAYTELLDAFHITADNSNDAYVTNCNIADKLMTLTLSDALYGTVNITLPDFIGMATPYGNVAPASKVITTAIPNFIDHTYLSYTLSDITAVIVPRPITTKKYTLGLKDSITYTVSDILAAIQIKPILTEKYTLGNPDSVTYTVSDITVAMTLRNASLQPI